MRKEYRGDKRGSPCVQYQDVKQEHLQLVWSKLTISPSTFIACLGVFATSYFKKQTDEKPQQQQKPPQCQSWLNRPAFIFLLQFTFSEVARFNLRGCKCNPKCSHTEMLSFFFVS